MTYIFIALLALSLLLLFVGLYSPKTISRLTRRKFAVNNALVWGLSMGFISLILTSLTGFSILAEKRQDIPEKTQELPLVQQEAVDEVDEVEEVEESTETQTKPTSTPKQSSVPKESAEEVAYKQLFVSTYNSVANSANSAQSTEATSESVGINKQEVINQRNTFGAAIVPASRTNSYNSLIKAIDILINDYFYNRGSSVTCSSGGGGSTGQLLLQACLTRRSLGNSAFSSYISQSQIAQNQFNQGQ